jgi:hypothetical protein
MSVPGLAYGDETWRVREYERSRVEVIQIRVHRIVTRHKDTKKRSDDEVREEWIPWGMKFVSILYKNSVPTSRRT